MYHQPSIELWLRNKIFTPRYQTLRLKVLLHLLASATLMDFPQFHDIHHLIPQILDIKLDMAEAAEFDYCSN